MRLIVPLTDYFCGKLQKIEDMTVKDHHFTSQREYHPRTSFGLFLIVLGLILLVATNDLLNFGSIKEYFTWQTALIFVGILLIVNLHFTAGLLLVAGGTWFLLDRIFINVPEMIKNIYWPGFIIIIGLTCIVSSFFRKKYNHNN